MWAAPKLLGRAIKLTVNLLSYSKAISPPKVDAIDASWRNLQDLGAVDGDDLTSPLTALGVHVSSSVK